MESNQSLRDRLAQLDVRIAILEAERKIIRKKLNSITYPILKLPFEVTSEIFFNCLPDIQDAHPIFDFSPERLPIPVLLTQICRVWRDIAFKTQKIWATFSLGVDEIWGQDHTHRSRRLCEWLEKAELSPLSFVLERRDIDRSSAGGTLPPLLRPILALSDQWQNVHLYIPYEELVKEQLQSDLRGRLHSLEKLRTIRNLGGGTDVVTAFELAPSLRCVVLEHLSHPFRWKVDDWGGLFTRTTVGRLTGRV
ncbi:hypothetical protein C8R45DRAFT_410500 [Mycena sanguinolenta]|nr:hypothetical protein C8R45DRAFT_410500 [Mycena sanguinolenta]